MALISSSEISAFVKNAAHEAGFELAGIAPASEFAELEYFPKWIAAGHAGEMQYMAARDESGNLKRSKLQTVAPWAKSVIVCAMNYNTAQPYSTEIQDPTRGWISRYAWSREDYHEAVMRRLRLVEAKLRTEVVTSGAKALSQGETTIAALRRCATQEPSDSPADENRPSGFVAELRRSEGNGAGTVLQTRCYVDTGPIVERVYAKYAGIGWVGKNTCILNQKMGSWLFLGVILTSIELAPDLPAPDRCGTCTRCIDACPTKALIAPYELDSNRCISYLTIEKRGAIPEDMRDGMGRHVFGCDICQDVCPWNRKAPATTAAEFQPREGLVNPALDWLAQIGEEEFREKFRGSPIRRAKRAGLRRNAVVAMGNSGEPRFLTSLEKLAADEDPIVAEHARWAARKLMASLHV